jgi:hypothetical protein
LARFLDEAFATSTQRPSRIALARDEKSARTHARRALLASMAERGLDLGAPLMRSEQQLSKNTGELASLIRWLAVVADEVDLIGHLLDEPGVSPAEAVRRRTSALAGALALVYGVDEDAQLLALGAVPSRMEKALTTLERELVKRRYLHGNPILGLLLNHAFLAVDTRALLLAVVDIYAGSPTKGRAALLQPILAAERLATLAAIARLSEWRELIDADLVRSASIWQVKSLGLSRAETARLLEQTKAPADLSRMVTLVPLEARERVFLHTVLAACVDGRVSPEERQLVGSLRDALGIGRPRAKRIEKRVMVFVRAHSEELNPLTHAAGFAAASPPISVRIARIVFENIDALWKEIRETGDLGFLLAKRAAGNRLSDDENKRMREQLVDVVKAVPSLAVFTLPGGFVLLPIMLKLLPFDLRPSSFRKTDDSFRAFAKTSDDAITQDDRERAENEFLRSTADS